MLLRKLCWIRPTVHMVESTLFPRHLNEKKKRWTNTEYTLNWRLVPSEIDAKSRLSFSRSVMSPNDSDRHHKTIILWRPRAMGALEGGLVLTSQSGAGALASCQGPRHPNQTLMQIIAWLFNFRGLICPFYYNYHQSGGCVSSSQNKHHLSSLWWLAGDRHRALAALHIWVLMLGSPDEERGVRGGESECCLSANVVCLQRALCEVITVLVIRQKKKGVGFL